MKILGTEKASLIEWPNHISYVIFVGGCNFRCPFCYVPHLVFEQGEEMPEDKILKEIQERANKKFIDGICITGGEPTMHSKLPDFLEKIKKIGLPIRLETNGSNPKLIEQLIKNKLIDNIALDIKNSKEKYQETCCSGINLFDITKTLSLIKEAEIDYEIRTTLVPGLHTKKDILDIAKWLYNIDNKKIKLYVLNQFKTDLPNEQTLNPEFIKKGNYSQEEINNIKEHLNELDYFEKIEIRGEN